jgi:hypothetical protein
VVDGSDLAEAESWIDNPRLAELTFIFELEGM